MIVIIMVIDINDHTADNKNIRYQPNAIQSHGLTTCPLYVGPLFGNLV